MTILNVLVNHHVPVREHPHFSPDGQVLYFHDFFGRSVGIFRKDRTFALAKKSGCSAAW